MSSFVRNLILDKIYDEITKEDEKIPVVDMYVIIEDKVGTALHSDQLNKYKKLISCKNKKENENRAKIKTVYYKIYDENNVEIYKGIMKNNLEDETYKSSDIRAGGKYEGRMYIHIAKGEAPATMIYSSNWNIWGDGEDEYIFDLK